MEKVPGSPSDVVELTLRKGPTHDGFQSCPLGTLQEKVQSGAGYQETSLLPLPSSCRSLSALFTLNLTPERHLEQQCPAFAKRGICQHVFHRILVPVPPDLSPERFQLLLL